jgi:hypothetical protein
MSRLLLWFCKQMKHDLIIVSEQTSYTVSSTLFKCRGICYLLFIYLQNVLDGKNNITNMVIVLFPQLHAIQSLQLTSHNMIMWLSSFILCGKYSIHYNLEYVHCWPDPNPKLKIFILLAFDCVVVIVRSDSEVTYTYIMGNMRSFHALFRDNVQV